MPGGKIMCYSGPVKQLNMTDDEIAVVMGHEIAHAVREHSREQVSQARAAQTAISVGTALPGLEGGSTDLAGKVREALIATRFTRTDDADGIGLVLAARARCNPCAGASFWQEIIKVNQGNRPPEFLSSHPAETNRIQQIESLLPVVVPLNEAARRRR